MKNSASKKVVSKTSIPVYRKIEADLRGRIDSGFWPAGAILPSRRRLADDYCVDLTTLQKAISGLLSDGLLDANPRLGTRVTLPPSAVASVLSPASAPRRVQTATLGIIVDSLHDNNHMKDLWVTLTASAVEKTFSHGGGTTRLLNRVSSGPNGETLVQPVPLSVESLLEQGADCLIIVLLSRSPLEIQEAFEAVRGRVPVVFVLSQPIELPVPHVFYDQSLAGYQAAQHLLRQGHRQLVFLAPFAAHWVEKRIAGAASAVRHAGLPATALRLLPETQAPYPDEGDFEADLRTRLRACVDLAQLAGTGVIAANDYTAFGLQEIVGEEPNFALVGFDDAAPAARRGLTSLRPPLEAMGEEAARLVMQMLDGKQAMMQVRLRSHLIARASSHTAAREGDIYPENPPHSFAPSAA